MTDDLQKSGGRVFISVVIPAYNEGRRVSATIEEVWRFFEKRKYLWQIIVVDDGSLDDTASVVENVALRVPGVQLLKLSENRGKGFAVRTGVGASDGNYVIFLDADGSTPIAELDRLKIEIDNGSDLAIGSRALKSADTSVKTSWYRKLFGRVFNLAVNIIIVPGVADTQCGFKMFRVQVAKDLFSRITADRFSFDVELLFLARYLGYKISEVPVNWTNVEGSKVNLVKDSLHMFFDILRFRWQAFRGIYGGGRRA